jgi:hypothetical protein
LQEWVIDAIGKKLTTMDSEIRNYAQGRPAPRQAEQRIEAEGPNMRVPRAQDHWRVNLSEAWEITFWAREFECSDGDLKAAVGAVGDCAGVVRAYLKQTRHQQRNHRPAHAS